MGIRSSVQLLADNYCQGLKSGVPFYLLESVRQLALSLHAQWIAIVDPFRHMAELLETVGFFPWDNGRYLWQGPERFLWDVFYCWRSLRVGGTFYVSRVERSSILGRFGTVDAAIALLPSTEQTPPSKLSQEATEAYAECNFTLLSNGELLSASEFM